MVIQIFISCLAQSRSAHDSIRCTSHSCPQKHPMVKVALPPRMSVGEKAMVINMVDYGMEPQEIADSTGRAFCTIYRTIQAAASQRKAARVGRPKELTSVEVTRIVWVLKRMVKEADSSWEVTLRMLMKRAKVKVCETTLRKAMQARVIRQVQDNYKTTIRQPIGQPIRQPIRQPRTVWRIHTCT